MNYEQWRKAFLDIVDLTAPDELAKVLPGRLRYDPETHKPMPFEGVSVIHNLDEEAATALRLPSALDEVRSGVAAVGLQSAIVLVNAKSFHATTFDLINRKHQENLGSAGYDYASVRAAVEREALTFLAGRRWRLSESVEVTGFDMFAPGVLKLNLSMPEAILDAFQEFRLALHGRLTERVPGYSTVRPSEWRKKLSTHVTLGYVVRPLSREGIDRFIDFAKGFNSRFVSIRLELTQGEVTRFSDMDHYSVVSLETTADRH